ncbi:MAG: outer membrane protein transport protein [Rhizomicrobium sp.]
MNRAIPALFFTPLLFGTAANATGFALREFSPAALGTAYAGAAANGEHASAIFYNPALLSGVVSSDSSVSATAILTNTDGDYRATTAAGTAVSGDATPTGFVTSTAVPATAFRLRLTDQWTVGVHFTMPWGMLSKYNDNWVGRYYAIKSEIQTRNTTVMTAYQISPELSVGGGLQVQFMKGYLSKAIDFGTLGYEYGFGTIPGKDDGFVVLKANDWGFGYILGASWKPRPDLTIGLSYRSRIAQTLAGTEHFTLDGAGVGAYLKAETTMFSTTGVHAKIDTPAVAMASIKWDVDASLSLMASTDWTGWYSVQSILAEADNTVQGSDYTAMDWKPSWYGAIGAEYKANEDWTLRMGTAYDASPTHTATRIPGIPDSSRIWLTFGAGYRWNEHVDLNVSYTRMFNGRATIDLNAADEGNALRGSLSGKGGLTITLIGLELDIH